jgi:peptidoglycan/xylan/chitin deacetylase (PgdA/CDA1 family)
VPHHLSTSPSKRGGRRARSLGAILATAAMALGLVACNGYDATSPASARKQVSVSGAKAFAQGPNGMVDCRKTKCVALTFDTGPSIHTPEILGYLRKYHAHATFFTLGTQVMRYPATARQMAAEGNEMETLTWDHEILTKIGKADVQREITQGRDAVQKITGIRPTLLRPPQGRTSDTVTGVAKRLGMAEVEWNDTASDYATTDSALITSRILKNAKPDGIILLHDSTDHTDQGYNGTAAAVPGILSGLEAQGYTFVTVAQLLAPGAPQAGKVYK